jgi:putative hemolysin
MAYFEILLVVALTILNGLLAMSELAIASSRMPKLRAMAEQGVTGARRAMVLASDPGRFLSTVQIGITLIGILAGAVSGAALGERTSLWFRGFGLSETVSEALGYGMVIGLITYLSLIIGELVPKQIALRNPERIACLVAPAMTLLAKVAAPVVWFLNRSGKLVLSVLGRSGARNDTVTDAEIHSLIAEAESAGVIEPEERTMIAGVMKLGDRPAKSVMIPSADVQMLDIASSPVEVGQLIAKTGHSRFVVFKDSPENIVGVLQVKDLAAAAVRRKIKSIRQLVKKAPVIPESFDALDIVNILKKSEVHFGLVYDEYGHFEGIVTTADILEAIVGTFREERREPEPEFVERADGSWLIAGWAPIESLQEKLRLHFASKPDFQTVAGYVLNNLGHLPKVGEIFEDRGFRFEVVDLDGKRIDKILATRMAPSTHRASR